MSTDIKTNRPILVTGATGQQGGTLARQLLDHGYPVWAMTRRPDSDAARELAERGARVVPGDFDDESSLEAALTGAWGAYSVQNTWEAGVEAEEQQGKRFAHQAREAGIEHFVYSSVASADRETGIPHFDNKYRVEQVIRGLGFPSYTIVRPVFFMENLLAPWFRPDIEEGRLTVGIRPDTTLQMIAVEDIGRHLFRAFVERERLAGKALDVAGDELTMPEVARLLTDATGREVTFEPTPIDQVREFSDDFASMLEWFDRVGYDVDISALSDSTGIEPTSFEEWLANAEWEVPMEA